MRFLLIESNSYTAQEAREHRGRCHLPCGQVRDVELHLKRRVRQEEVAETFWAGDTARGKARCLKWQRGAFSLEQVCGDNVGDEARRF